MKTARILAISLLLTAAAVRGQEKPQDKFQTSHTFSKKVRESCDYLLFLPKDYEKAKNERWPLILFLHGAGERGTNVWRTDFHGPSKYIASHPDFPFIMVSPLCPADQVWSNELLLNLLDDVVRKYDVDTNRVYLTGLSMGGFGTWELALAAPERFAAVIPIAGGGDDLPIVLAALKFDSPARVAALKSLAFWAFHGAKDTVVNPEDSQRLVAGLRKMGVAEVKLTIYPDATHNSWERTYNNPGIYDWLLQHKR